MLNKQLDEISEADLAALVAESIPEGFTLEFKRQLNIQSDTEKRELAKDVSALANAAGGRILFGIDEREQKDGSRVAAAVVPLTDRSLQGRLEDILHSRTHPRPRFYLREVPVENGYVLVADVASSAGIDLHMVSDGRFYRRGNTTSVLMTEPEVRDAYVQIAERRASFESRLNGLIEPECERRKNAQESVLVVPLYPRPSLIDPRNLPRDLNQLADATLSKLELGRHLQHLRLVHDGYRAPGFGFSIPYLAILRTGLVHTSYDGAFYQSDQPQSHDFRSGPAAKRILQSMALAHLVLQRAAYTGPVRIRYQLRPRRPWRIDPDPYDVSTPTIPVGDYTCDVPEVSLESTKGSWGWVVKELLDRVFQAGGTLECPQFTAAGLLYKTQSTEFAAFTPYLKVEG